MADRFTEEVSPSSMAQATTEEDLQFIVMTTAQDMVTAIEYTEEDMAMDLATIELSSLLIFENFLINKLFVCYTN